MASVREQQEALAAALRALGAALRAVYAPLVVRLADWLARRG